MEHIAVWQWLVVVVIANLIIGILWSLTVKETSQKQKILMIITGVVGYVAVFIGIIVLYLYELSMDSALARETSLNEMLRDGFN